MSEIIKQAEQIKAEIDAFEPSNAEELEQFRIKYIGSKGLVKSLFAQFKDVPNEEKKAFGQLMNALKTGAETKVADYQQQFTNGQSKAKTDIDLTAPGKPITLGSKHPITIVKNELIEIFSRIGFAVNEGPEIEDDWHNFTALNTPKDHPARDMQDTFYLTEDMNWLLRTHTSPGQIRVMEEQQPPIRIISPGRVFRNETISARAHCTFHQVEGLYIDQNVSMADLKQTMYYFAKELLKRETKVRFRPSYFPFTEPSAEFDLYWGLEDENDYRITKGTGWLEMGGCGMVDPNVLQNCNIDPEKYTGFAFGIGIDRLAMLKFGIHDIRQFWENDIRFINQFKAAF